MWWRRAAWLVLVLACSDLDRATGPSLEELRVSTHRGLDPVLPPSGQTISAQLVELVCPSVDQFLDSKRITQSVFELRSRGTGSRSLAEFAPLIRSVALDSVRIEGEVLRVTLKPDATDDIVCIEDGQYRVASQTPSELVLERRTGNGAPRIRVLNMRDSEEEWRRFLAGEADIVPVVNRSQVRYLRELATVRLTQVPDAPSIGLIFNPSRVPLAVRRGVVLAIHRKAVARTLSLEEGSAESVPEDSAEAARVLAANDVGPFRILTYQGDADMRRAALVVEENLTRAGLSPVIELLDIDQSLVRAKAGDYEAWLFFVSYTKPVMWRRFRSGDSLNFGGYTNTELDSAIDSGNLDRIRAIMDREALITPLFHVEDVIASERRLCGVKPNLVDLVWLSGVHVCAPGEME